MMYLKLTNSKVTTIAYVKPKDISGWTAYDGEIPTVGDEQHLEYLNGQVVAVDNVSNSDLRRMAYEQECDPLLPSIQSYELQGKTEQLEAVKAEWLARHKAIEERYPNEVTE